MPFINDSVLKDLEAFGGTTVRVDITTSLATTYSNVTSNTLGNKTSVAMAAVGDAGTDGQKVSMASSITDGAVTTEGTASHYALSNGSNLVYASGELAGNVAVATGSPFTLAIVDVIIRDAAAV